MSGKGGGVDGDEGEVDQRSCMRASEVSNRIRCIEWKSMGFSGYRLWLVACEIFASMNYHYNLLSYFVHSALLPRPTFIAFLMLCKISFE